MGRFIIDFQEMKHMNFKQASIYLDACFILAYLDLSDDRGDKVTEIIDYWKDSQIKALAISNHVMGEIVHNLFKNYLRDVLTIIHSSNIRKREIKEQELLVIGDKWTAYQLTQLVPTQKLDTLVNEGELFYNLDKVIKEFKNTYPLKRDGLNFYYNEAVNKYNGTIQDLCNMGFKIFHPPSNEEIHDLALAIMRTLQIDAHDAIHLAIARFNQYDFFATLDSDIVHSFYSEDTIGYF